MAVTYTDSEIAALVRERKPLSQDWRRKLSFRGKGKRGELEARVDCTGDGGNAFRLILRRNAVNHLDFSVIMAVQVPQSNQLFRLRRCNGKSHEHTNHIEGDKFYDFHIHAATARYQEIGSREDTYAEVTDEYGDFDGAVDLMVRDGAFDVPPSDQLSFF